MKRNIWNHFVKWKIEIVLEIGSAWASYYIEPKRKLIEKKIKKIVIMFYWAFYFSEGLKKKLIQYCNDISNNNFFCNKNTYNFALLQNEEA